MTKFGTEVSEMNAHKADNRSEKAQGLCEKLYLVAKKSKTRRFHQLYDKVYRMDILSDAWKTVKRNGGSAGVDDVSIQDIVEQGEDKYLEDLHDLLLDTHRYHPRKIRRVYIPKASGGQRPLGIPAIRDRIVQTATKTLLEPIFEADFLDCSYGFRPGRSAHDALEKIWVQTNRDYRFVLDADIKGYFDSINHEHLFELLRLRLSDRKVLKLIRKWLECGVIGELEKNEMGTPQGGVISPLLANIYLHEFDKFWTEQKDVHGRLIRYADDFVILFKTKEDAERGLKLASDKLKEMGLELNEKKTSIVSMNGGHEGFDFLGFHHRRVRHDNKCFRTYTWPKEAAVRAIRQKVKAILAPRPVLLLSREELFKRLNPVLRGWQNYFRYGNSAGVFSSLDTYVHERMSLWYSKKHQKGGRGWSTRLKWDEHKTSGVVLLSGSIRYLSANRTRKEEGHLKAV